MLESGGDHSLWLCSPREVRMAAVPSLVSQQATSRCQASTFDLHICKGIMTLDLTLLS